MIDCKFKVYVMVTRFLVFSLEKRLRVSTKNQWQILGPFVVVLMGVIFAYDLKVHISRQSFHIEYEKAKEHKALLV